MKAISGLPGDAGSGGRLGRGLAVVAVAAMALLLAGCASPHPAVTVTVTAKPSAAPTIAPAACTFSAVREEVPGASSLGDFAVALTNTSPGTCVLSGTPTATLSGGKRGDEGVGPGTAKGLPAGKVVVPAGATAYAPVALSTTTDGGIDAHCTDSGHTTLLLTPPGSPTALSVDVSLLHPCTPAGDFGWAVYPIQGALPSASSFG